MSFQGIIHVFKDEHTFEVAETQTLETYGVIYADMTVGQLSGEVIRDHV